MAGSVVTIGNFDGCHAGHQALLQKAFEISKSYEVEPLVYTFDPHPQEFFSKSPQPRLFSTEQRIRALRELGMSQIVIQHFDQSFSELSHQDFYQKYLVEQFAAKAIVVGEDFRFGHKRLGDIEYLKSRATKDGISISALSPLKIDNIVVSSSRIRTLLSEEGNLALATKMLTRPYILQGVVVQGKQIGRTLGFPTANVAQVQQLLPKNGVYAGYANLDGTSEITKMSGNLIPMVANIGYRPTMEEGRELSVETHLIEGAYSLNELYGKNIALYFVSYLRPEMAFSGRDQLTKQIKEDITQAKKDLA